MDALVIGTGGAGGWPEDGCRCASCMRARSAGLRRASGRVLVDGWLEVVPGRPLLPGTGPSPVAALHIERLPGGLDITSPDGTRLLLAAGPGEVPEPQPGASAYDLVLLDLLASPVQLGRLRASGLVHRRTAVAALYTDHRISSTEEMARRCAIWGADQAHDGQLITGPAAADVLAVIAWPHRTLIIGGARSGKSTEAELRLAAEPQVTYVAAGPFPPLAQDGLPRPDSLRCAADSRPEGDSSQPEGDDSEPDVAESQLEGDDGRPEGADSQPESADSQSWTGPDGESWTGPDGEPDSEWARRVAIHRARRPGWWRTVESLDLAGILSGADGALLIDGIGTWLAAVLDEAGMWAADDPLRGAAPDGGASHGAASHWAASHGAADLGSDAERARPDPEALIQARIDELLAAWRQTSALVVAVTDQVGSGLVPAYPAGRVFRDQLGWLNQRLAAESELNLQVVAGRVTTLPG